MSWVMPRYVKYIINTWNTENYVFYNHLNLLLAYAYLNIKTHEQLRSLLQYFYPLKEKEKMKDKNEDHWTRYT